MSLSVQIATLLSMVGTGMGMAWIYDFYSWFRKRLHPHPAIVFLWDVAYWLLFAALVFAVLSRVNDGRLRVSVFFALLIGGILYFLYFSRPFLEAWEVIVSWTAYLFRLLYAVFLRLVVRPVQWLAALIFAFMLGIGMGIWKASTLLVAATFRIFSTILRPLQRFSLALVRFLGKIVTRLIPFLKRDE